MNVHRSTIVLLGVLATTGCAGDPAEEDGDTPEIVEVFACSDYCPGPEEKYLKRVYKGVSDEVTCRKLGGRPYTYIGWGEYTVCVAE